MIKLGGRKTVCIVGTNSQLWAGLKEHSDGDEWWGLNQGHLFFPIWMLRNFTRWFQIHAWGPMVARQRPEVGHIEWLAKCGLPVYLEETRAEIPTGVRYPY